MTARDELAKDRHHLFGMIAIGPVAAILEAMERHVLRGNRRSNVDLIVDGSGGVIVEKQLGAVDRDSQRLLPAWPLGED